MAQLNDLFISHDAIGILKSYLKEEGVSLPEFQRQLDGMANKGAISFEAWWALLDELDCLLEQPILGTRIGARVTPKQSGILGYLTQTSASMLDALRCFERFQRLIYEGNTAQIDWQGEVCTLTWNISHGHSTQISDEVVFSSLLSVMRYCLQDPSASLLSVAFSGAPMGPANLYQEYYGCEVQFNQLNISMSVDSKYLLMPFESSDPGLHSLLFEQALNKLPKESVERDFVGDLHQATVRALHEGQPTAAHIASKLHMSSRTLHRRLDGLGYVFRDFLKAIRKKMAQEYLDDEHFTLSEIALLLGYSEQSAFSRAFADWFDMSPSEYKVNPLSLG